MSSPIKFIKLDWVLSLSLHANRLLMGPPHQSILNTQLLLNLRDSKKLKLKLGLPLPINYIREEFMLHYASVLFTEVFLRCSIFFFMASGYFKEFPVLLYQDHLSHSSLLFRAPLSSLQWTQGLGLLSSAAGVTSSLSVPLCSVSPKTDCLQGSSLHK